MACIHGEYGVRAGLMTKECSVADVRERLRSTRPRHSGIANDWLSRLELFSPVLHAVSERDLARM